MQRVVLGLCVVGVTSQAATVSDTFQHLTLPDGTEVCAADPPTEVTWLRDGSRAACGMQCLVRPACETFNIRWTTDGTVQCQLYNYKPTNIIK